MDQVDLSQKWSAPNEIDICKARCSEYCAFAYAAQGDEKAQDAAEDERQCSILECSADAGKKEWQVL